MARRLLESLSGTGALHAGDVMLRAVTYELSLWADDQAQTPGGDGVSIDGRIDIIGIAEAVVLAGPGGLILTIEDGRRVALHLTSTGGAFVGSGWLP